MAFFGLTLVALIVLAFMLGFMLADMKKVYNVNRAKLLAGKACITDTSTGGWKALPDKLYKGTDMSNEHNWVVFFQVVIDMTIVALTCVIWKVTTELDKLSKGQEAYEL